MDSSNNSFTPQIEIHLFGRFCIYINGNELREKEIKGRKARSLLKLIASQRNFQMVRDRILDELWPDLDSEAAKSQLYKALHHIRRALEKYAGNGSDWVVITDNLLRIDPPHGITTDVKQFEEIARSGLRNRNINDLEKAISLYQGDFLPMDRYTEWTSLPREHYRQLYLDLLTALAKHYEKQGEYSEAAQRLRQALEKEPTLETAHRGMMRIFAHKGQATRAFHQYEICRKVLRDELGVSPSPETMEILDQIRNGEFPKNSQSPHILNRDPNQTSKTPLIGRTEEKHILDNMLQDLASGHGGSLLICGEAGIGKTRLVRELNSKAQQNNLIAYTGHTSATSGNVAYRTFIGLFDEILLKHPDMQKVLPVEIGRLVPGYRGNGQPAPHADKLAAKGYLFAQIQRFFSILSEKEPTAVILEDIHEADKGSRELLSYLVEHRGRLPLLYVITLRKDESEPAPEFISGLQKHFNHELELASFSYEEHVNLLHLYAENAIVSADIAGKIYQLAQGNPFYAIELLRHYSETGETIPEISTDEKNVTPASSISTKIPPSIQQMVQQKMKKISPAARHLLFIAAVIGSRVPYEVLSAIWSSGKNNADEGLFDALEESIRTRFLEEHGLDYSFRHALVQETIYRSISEARRQILHKQAAREFLNFYSDSKDIPVEQIAKHYAGAAELEKGATYLLKAGKKAEEAYAHEDALRYLQEALDLIKQVDNEGALSLKCQILEQTGDVYRACGKLEKSYDAYQKALDQTAETVNNPELIELHRKMSVAAIFRTDIERSEIHLEEAFKLISDFQDPQLEARLLITKALHLWHLNQLEKAYEIAKKAHSKARHVNATSVISQACEILAMICLPLGRWEEGLKYEMERQVHGWSPDVVVATDAHLCLWEYHVSGDQPLQKAQSFMNKVSEQATEAGDLRCVAVCHYALGTMHLWRGNRRQAVEELTSSLNLHEQVGSPAGMAYSLARKSVIHTMMGAKKLGWQSVQEGFNFARQAAVRDHCLQRLYGVGLWNRLEDNDLEVAGELAGQSEKLLSETGACGACALELYPWLAYYYLKISRFDKARECEMAVTELAQKTGNPIGKAISCIIKSNISVTEKDQKSAEKYIRQSKEIIEKTVPDTGYSPLARYLQKMIGLHSD